MLELKDVSCRLGGKSLLEDITLCFRPGVLYGVVGPNGSGKSTLLKTMAAIWPLCGGHVRWQDEELFSKDRREISRIVTLLPQELAVFFDYSVDEFVSMGRYPHTDNLTTSEEVVTSLKAVDALGLRGQLVQRLSRGEKQRVYLARALATQAPCLLLDEPMASLDVAHQRVCWRLLQSLASSGKVVIVTLHDFAAAERFCQEIVLMSRGRVTASGPFEQVVTEASLQEAFGMDFIEELYIGGYSHLRLKA